MRIPLACVQMFERAVISERVKAGIANAGTKGRHFGRPSLAIDTTKVQALRQAGRSIRKIAHDLRVSRASVHKTLSHWAS